MIPHTAERQDDILEFLRRNGPSTVAEIVEALDADRTVTRSDVMRMEGRSIRRAGWSHGDGHARRLWRAIG